MDGHRIDKVTMDVLKSHFVAIAEGMGYTLERTSHTTFIKETADFATAIATPEGEFFAYPRNVGVSSFLGLSMRKAISAFDHYEPGDIVITNDPYTTDGLATHLPDIHLIKPIFQDGRLICFAWCFIHCSDVGGLVAASISPRAYEIQQEGIRIPPRKLYRAGELDRHLLDLFLANCRIPDQNWGDIKAMVAALNTAEQRMAKLCGKFGTASIQDAMYAILDWTEQRARAILREIPDGDYAFADYMDDDMNGAPIRLAVTLRVRGEQVEVDYAGTDPQVNAALNLPAFGDRHPYLAQGLINFFLSEDPHIPLTGGIMRPVRTIAPRGTVVNPLFPAAVGVRYATVIRLYDVVLGALAQAVPGRVPAATAGQAAMVVLSVPQPETGQRQVTVLEPVFGGGGATRRADGVAGVGSSSGYLKNTPVESVESHIPVLIERYELLPDSAGPGRHRGGWGNQFDFRTLQPDSIVTARGMERCRFEPWGLAGGRSAGRTTAFLNPGTDREQEIGRIDILHLEPGDVVSIRAGGGGGYGDPLERDPAGVARDVRSGLLSPTLAAEAYGVVVAGGAIDESATRDLRRELADGRATAPPAMDLGPARLNYEAVWTPELSVALARLLMELPPGLRIYAKRELHRRIDTGNWDGPLTAQGIRILWDQISAKGN